MDTQHLVFVVGDTPPDLAGWFDPEVPWRIRVDPSAADARAFVAGALPRAEIHVGPAVAGVEYDIVVLGPDSDEARALDPWRRRRGWWRDVAGRARWIATLLGVLTVMACGGADKDQETGPRTRCGNDRIEGSEECDGTAVPSCQELGFEGGESECSFECDAVLAAWCDPAASDVVLNEVDHMLEKFELYNRGSRGLEIGGWSVVDRVEIDNDRAYTFPGFTRLEPGKLLVVTATSFGIGSDDVLVLRDGDGTVRDMTTWFDGARSRCRLPDGGLWQDLCTPTLGEPNEP